MLTTDTESPHVTKTSVVAHLLQTVKVLANLVVDLVGQALHGGSVLGVLHSVEEPCGHLEVLRLGDDLHDTLHLFVREGARTAVGVHACALAGDESETAADSLHGADGVGHLLLAVNVRVQDTQHVLEVLSSHGERHIVGCESPEGVWVFN